MPTPLFLAGFGCNPSSSCRVAFAIQLLSAWITRGIHEVGRFHLRPPDGVVWPSRQSPSRFPIIPRGCQVGAMLHSGEGWFLVDGVGVGSEGEWNFLVGDFG